MTFDPTDPSTWGSAQARKTRGPRPRFPRTQSAINDLIYALEGARHALSALNDPDYFEKHVADMEQRIGHEVSSITDRNPPDPDFERWDHRASDFQNHLKSAMLFTASAMQNLLFAETAEGRHPPKRRRTTRTRQ
jgi:hypothetical protein